MMIMKAGMKIRHYKGGRYTVLGLSIHTETLEKLVVYQSDIDNKIWSRPIEMFYDRIDNDYYRGSRFTIVDE